MSRGAARARRVGWRLGCIGATVVVAALLGLGYWYDSPKGKTGQWLVANRLEARFATVRGRRVRYVQAGVGPAVVFIHGFASSMYTWKDVLPKVLPGHEVVAVDLPGFGGSEAPGDLSFGEYVPLVVSLLDQLGVERATLVGNSMGGGVAILVAAENPARVSGLVLVDAAVYRMGDPGKRPWPIRMAGSPAAGALLDRLPLRRLLVREGLRQVFHDDSLVTAERVEEYAQPVLREGVPAAIRSLLSSRSLTPDLVEAQLGKVSAPSLVIWGREDAWLPAADADKLAGDLRARKVVIDGCGHMPQEERPEEVGRLIREFVDAPR